MFYLEAEFWLTWNTDQHLPYYQKSLQLLISKEDGSNGSGEDKDQAILETRLPPLLGHFLQKGHGCYIFILK